MKLLFAPYAPSVFEGFMLAGRYIRGDVHDWLISRVGAHSRWAHPTRNMSRLKYLP